MHRSEHRHQRIPEYEDKIDRRMRRGAFDQATKRYSLAFDGETKIYSIINPGQGPICMLVKGDPTAADLRESWFSPVPEEPDPYSDKEPPEPN